MPDIINENEREALALQQIASLRRRRALARNNQAITRRSRDLLRERNELTTQLEKLQSELRTINANIMDVNADIVTIRRRMETASQRATHGRTLATQEQIRGNIGDTHRSARSAYENYRNANPNDTDGISQRYSDYIAIGSAIHATSQERVIPLVAESNRVVHTMLAAEESLINLTSRQSVLRQEIAELEARLSILDTQSDELNRARGKKRRHKKGTKVKHGGAWTLKYKRSINCMRPKGFSQKQYCKYGRKK
jgi:hypothetical protein